MWDLIPDSIRNLIDTIFAPPIEFLEMVVEYIGHIAMVAGKGINLQNYFSFFGFLPASLQLVVNSIVASVVFLTILLLVRSIWRMYFAAKDGLKWW